MASIWFGNDIHAQWVPCPASGMVRSRERYTEELQFTNGGRWIERSAASASRFSIDLPVADSSEYEGIEAYQAFADGNYGDSFLRFDDPFAKNKMTAVWSQPGLTEQGWKPIYDTTPSFSATDPTGVSSYHYPPRSAVYDITTTAHVPPTGQNSVTTILIPPNGELFIRWVGSVTGTAVLKVQPINLDGTLGSDDDLSPISQSTAPSFGGGGYLGTSYRAVQIYLSRTSSAASTATVTAIYASMGYDGVDPTITQHIPGKGHCGLYFSGNAEPEVYIMSNRHLVGGSFELAEVEAWQ